MGELGESLLRGGTVCEVERAVEEEVGRALGTVTRWHWGWLMLERMDLRGKSLYGQRSRL